MPSPSTSSPIELPFPRAGVFQGEDPGKAPPLTCPDARNVRALTVGDRHRGGRRPGLSKVWSDPVGASGARRVNHLNLLNRTTLISGDDVFDSSETIEDTFQRADGALGEDWIVCASSTADVGSDANPTGAALIASMEVAIDASDLGGGDRSNAGLILCNGLTTNKVYSRWRVAPIADATNITFARTSGNVQNCHEMGPIIRVNEELSEGITARLIRDGADTTVRLALYKISSTRTFTLLAQSDQLTISGSSSQEGSAGDTGTDSLEIDLEDFGSYVVATARWTNQVGSDSAWGGAGVSVSYTTADYAENRLAGVRFDEDSDLVSGPDTRTLGYLKLFRLVPNEPVVLLSIDGDDAPLSLRYQLPAGWTAYTHNVSTDAVTTQAGPFESGSLQVFPTIDTTDTKVETTSAASTDAWIERTVAPTAPANLSFQWGLSGNNRVYAFFRIAADQKSYLRIRLTLSHPDDNDYSLTSIRLERVIGTAETTVATVTAYARINVASRIHICDERQGSGETETAIRVYSEGRLLMEYVPIAGDLTGLELTSYRCGAGASANAINQQRLEILEGLGATNLPDKVHYILAVTGGAISTGRLDVDSVSAVTGPALANRYVTSFAANLKWYAVDGEGAIIIDPLNLTSTDWAQSVTDNGEGSLPASCRLAALYRGRAVLARQPDNASIWYMSRVADVLDWDFGADPVATAAVAGTSALVGLPGDELTALISYGDDYLIFGGSTSIWRLVGDPGYGGTVELLTAVTGIGNAHAWTFDHNGNLWMLGNSGIYVLPPGGDQPTLVGSGRLPAYLDRVNFDTTLVHMAFDLFRKEIVIHLTPADELTTGLHVALELDDASQAIGFWIDEYPLEAGPFASLTMPVAADADRRPLLGGLDGYIRRQADDALDDDGTTIASFLRYSPISLLGELTEVMADTIQGRLGSGSGDLAWYLLGGDDPEAVGELGIASALASGSFAAGYNSPQSARARAGALQLYLSHSTAAETWSIGSINLWLRPRGRRR